jgi:hypothetical protein
MFAHRYGEVSVGKINIQSKWQFKLEAFGGAGMGRATDFVADYYADSYKTDYYSFFGQGNMGFKKQEDEVGFSVRLAYTMFDYTAIYDKDYFFQTKFSAINFEPMMVVRAGKKNLKIVSRIGLNLMFPINLNKEDVGSYYRGFTDLSDLDYTVFHLSVGLSYKIEINNKFKNK